MTEEFEETFEKEKKYFMFFAMAICIYLIVSGGITLYKFKQCNDEDGLFMENKECYIPKSVEERQQMMEDGYLKTKGLDPDNIIMNWSME